MINLNKITEDFFNADFKMIYHYTSPMGLKGILETNTLWFTRSDYLNDLTETNYIINVLENILNLEYDKDFTTYITKQYLDKIKKGELERKRYEYYICSFSKAKDELSLWNYYTKGPSKAGYNIGIMTNELMNSLKIAYNLDFKCGIVLYSTKEQVQLLKSIVDELYTQYLDIVNKTSKLELDTIIDYLYDYIELLAPYFKHPAFKNERECRIVCSVKTKEDIEDIIQIREQNGIFVPYIQVLINKETIKTITTSPYIIADNVLESIQEITNKYKYQVKSNKSNIPVRKQ